MAKTPTDQQTFPFHYRPGADPFGPSGWRGVNSQRSPGSLDPNELVRGDDIRLRGGEIVPRSPIEEVAVLSSHPISEDTIMWIHEAPIDNPFVRLWGSNLGCFGVETGLGATIVHIDPAELPIFQVVANFRASGTRQDPLGRYGTTLYVGDRTALRKILEITAPPGESVGTIALAPAAVAVCIFEGFKIRCLQEFDGKFFIGLENEATPAASKIVSYNGLGFTDDLTGIRPPLAFGIWRDKLVCGFDSTAGHVRYRNEGDAPGTWTTVASAGFQCATQGNAMQEFGDKLYIASGIDDLWSFDGAALAVENTIATAALDGFGVTALTLHNDLLYYGWNQPSGAPGYESHIGRHDPASTAANEWVDNYVDLTAQQTNFRLLECMKSYRQQIYVGGNRTWVLATKENDVKGTVQTVNTAGVGAAGFGLVQFIQFP